MNKLTMQKKIIMCASVFALFNGYSPVIAATAALKATVNGKCQTPSQANVSITVATNVDAFTIDFASGSLTPSLETIFTLTPDGNVCRFSVTAGNGTLDNLFSGMTFSSPSLNIQNSTADSSGVGAPGTSNTPLFTINDLSGTSLNITNGSGVEIQKRATAGTNFSFSSAASVNLTGYPADESVFTQSSNAFVTIPITYTGIPG